MDIKLAPTDLEQQSTKTIKLESVLNAKESLQVLYLSKQNSQKDLQKAKTFLESKGKTVYISEMRYGLDANDFIYECRIL